MQRKNTAAIHIAARSPQYLNYKNQLASGTGQFSNVSQTGSPRSFARILSGDCSKMLRARPLTASFQGPKIKDLVPFCGTDWKARSRP
jgi:hypothetical protein